MAQTFLSVVFDTNPDSSFRRFLGFPTAVPYDSGTSGPNIQKISLGEPPIRALEILWIVLFRFRPVPRIWAILLICVNALSLLFLDTIYGQVALAAIVAAIIVMVVIHARLGFVRLLGIGHIFWIPMLIGFALHLPDATEQPALYYWVISLLVCDTISLVIDTIDVVRFFRGQRRPHYTWESR